MAVSLKDIEAMVDTLEPTDQVRLLQYLVPRLTDAMLAAKSDCFDAAHAWQEFRRVGERLAIASASESAGESITQAISEMRR